MEEIHHGDGWRAAAVSAFGDDLIGQSIVPAPLTCGDHTQQVDIVPPPSRPRSGERRNERVAPLSPAVRLLFL